MLSNDVFNKLKADNIIGASGFIEFSLGKHKVKIDSRDSVGNLIQVWFENWLLHHFPKATKNNSSQKFPDFFLNPKNKTQDLLEVKSFDIDNGPGFDVANFDSYCNSLTTEAFRLDSNYLIFAYRMTGSNIEIVDVWLKKVWEITGGSGTYPLKVQEKKGVIYNIRPVIWYSNRATFKPFKSRLDFVNAINATRYQYPQTHFTNAHWLNKVVTNYLLFTKSAL